MPLNGENDWPKKENIICLTNFLVSYGHPAHLPKCVIFCHIFARKSDILAFFLPNRDQECHLKRVFLRNADPIWHFQSDSYEELYKWEQQQGQKKNRESSQPVLARDLEKAGSVDKDNLPF